MPILNYTTSIDAYKTVIEIQRILVSVGAQSINIDYDQKGNPVALTFFMIINNRPVNYRLPSNYRGVLKKLNADKKVPTKLKSNEQAIRVSWRIIKDWCEAQMAIIEAGLAELPEIFLPYAVAKDGDTLFNKFKNNQLLLE